MKNNQKDIITILDIKLTKDGYPKLYRWASRNPDGLKKTILSFAKDETNPNYEMIAINLEMDLQHV